MTEKEIRALNENTDALIAHTKAIREFNELLATIMSTGNGNIRTVSSVVSELGDIVERQKNIAYANEETASKILNAASINSDASEKMFRAASMEQDSSERNLHAASMNCRY